MDTPAVLLETRPADRPEPDCNRVLGCRTRSRNSPILSARHRPGVSRYVAEVGPLSYFSVFMKRTRRPRYRTGLPLRPCDMGSHADSVKSVINAETIRTPRSNEAPDGCGPSWRNAMPSATRQVRFQSAASSPTITRRDYESSTTARHTNLFRSRM